MVALKHFIQLVELGVPDTQGTEIGVGPGLQSTALERCSILNINTALTGGSPQKAADGIEQASTLIKPPSS